jgi:beta-N-acetylhexosaminidase
MRLLIPVTLTMVVVGAGFTLTRPDVRASTSIAPAAPLVVAAAEPDPIERGDGTPAVDDGARSKGSAQLAQAKAPAAPPTKPAHGIDIDGILASLTLDEKIGQLMLLGFGGTTMDETVERFLDEKKPGGVALFARNIKTVPQTVKLIRDVRSHDPHGIPMFVSVDQEGGHVVRIKKDVIVLPSAMALGAADDEDLAFRVGIALGRDMHIMGFNMNLAPVLDVNSNPKNPVIGIRSFGEDPVKVGAMGAAYLRGLQQEGVVAVAKHFPGHGDTEDDSHQLMPVLSHDEARLKSVELIPFKRAFEAGLDALMTAHISLPRIAEEPDMPSTVSKNVLTGIARDELGYKGVIMTDGLEMNGIVDRYGSGEAAVRAVQAGADMVMVLWFPEKKDEVQRALTKAVQEGRISKARLDESVRRILELKARRGLFTPLLNTSAALAKLKDGGHRKIVDEVARRAITLVKNDGEVLPLSPLTTVGEGDKAKTRATKVVIASSEPVFTSMLKKRLKGASSVTLSPVPSRLKIEKDAAKILSLAKGADVVVIGVMDGLNNDVVKTVKKARPDLPVVVVSFGSPYLLSSFPDVEGYVCAFGFYAESEVAAARALLGDDKPDGTLPVSLTDGIKRGHRLTYTAALKGSLDENQLAEVR